MTGAGFLPVWTSPVGAALTLPVSAAPAAGAVMWAL
jgi:hypothetical protein